MPQWWTHWITICPIPECGPWPGSPDEVLRQCARLISNGAGLPSSCPRNAGTSWAIRGVCLMLIAGYCCIGVGSFWIKCQDGTNMRPNRFQFWRLKALVGNQNHYNISLSIYTNNIALNNFFLFDRLLVHMSHLWVFKEDSTKKNIFFWFG